MRVEVMKLPSELGDADRSGELFIVVDVLRLCSTMLTAFANGCEAVIPMAEPAEALALHEKRPELLVAGERGGYKVEGFDLGNSPFEMTREVVGGRTLAACSTNGSKAIVASRAGAETILACFLNVSAAAGYVRASGRNAVILCAGKEGAPSLEDLVCAGLFVEKLTAFDASPAALGAGAEEAAALYRTHSHDLRGMVEGCEHGRYLTSIGMGRDVPYCAQLDLFDLVPRLVGGEIRCQR